MTTVVYKINPKDSEEFEWDSNKATSNLQKHGITFQTAAEVFLDPLEYWEIVIIATGAKLLKRKPGTFFQLFKLRFLLFPCSLTFC